MDIRRRNEAKRFILLIDTLYDAGARVFISAAAQPDALYTASNGTEAFEFDRTVSRLIEMQSQDWLEQTGPRMAEKSTSVGEQAAQTG
jgi:cell division protein ZapE